MKKLILCSMVLASGSALAAGADTEPLGLERLQNSVYSGFESIDGEVELRSGQWEGEPFAPGSASAPRVVFAGDLVARGDLDSDSRDEAVVVLTTSFGGTGVFHYLAVVAAEGEGNRNVATVAAGDRIQIRDLRIEEGRVLLDLVRAGPNDAACCPTEVVTLSYRFDGGRLTGPEQIGERTMLSPAVLAGQTWRLSAWKRGEPAQRSLTLAWSDGRFVCNAGCNQYSASVKATDDHGSLEVGQALSTRKYCGPEVMEDEQRFLELLPRVNRLWFYAGQLALGYGSGTDFGVMFLDRED
jgi:heat shock protein HslJ